MKKTLPCLTCGAIWLIFACSALAAGPPTVLSPNADAAVAADKHLADALRRLALTDTISAKFRQQVDLLGEQLLGDGLYLQSASGSDVLLRWELKMQIADSPCSILQVCDGRDLWIERQFDTQRTVERMDTRMVARLVRPHKPRVDTLAGGRLPLGGLQEWLNSLVVNFQFTLAGQTELSEVPMLMLVGRWRQDRLQAMLPDQAEQIAAGQQPDLNEMPEHLPQEIVLLLGQDDLFPYLIDYRRYHGGNGAAPEPRSILRVQIYEVRINAPVDLRQFAYQPGPVDVVDATDNAAKLLLHRAQRQAAARK